MKVTVDWCEIYQRTADENKLLSTVPIDKVGVAIERYMRENPEVCLIIRVKR